MSKSPSVVKSGYFGELSGGICHECESPLVYVPTADGMLKEELCSSCGIVRKTKPNGHIEQGDKYGRAPTHAAVLWNNLGTVPGPEMNKEVMSALNQEHGAYTGLQFEEARRDLLKAWQGGSKSSDDVVKELFASMIKTVEAKRGRKIPEQRVNALGQLISKCVRRGERVRHQSAKDTQQTIESILRFEGLWPP